MPNKYYNTTNAPRGSKNWHNIHYAFGDMLEADFVAVRQLITGAISGTFTVFTLETRTLQRVSNTVFKVMGADVSGIYKPYTALFFLDINLFTFVQSVTFDGTDTVVTIRDGGGLLPSPLISVRYGIIVDAQQYVGTAGRADIGTEPEQIPTNELLSLVVEPPYLGPPQSIIKAKTGMLPPGLTNQDSDNPIISMITRDFGTQLSASGVIGTIYATTQYDNTSYQAWKMLNGIQATPSSNSWLSSSQNTEETITLILNTPRSFDKISLGAYTDSAGFSNNSISNFEVIVDGVSHGTFNGITWATTVEIKEFTLTSPVVNGSVVSIRTYGNSSRTGCGTLKLHYTDVPVGEILVRSGIQVSFADNKRVRSSVELLAEKGVNHSNKGDGTYYVYINLAEDGTITDAGITDIPPEVGILRSGVDILPTFSNYTVEGWGTVTATSFQAGQEPWKVLDRNPNTYWLASNTAANDLTFDIGTRKCVGLSFETATAASSPALRYLTDYSLIVNGVETEIRQNRNDSTAYFHIPDGVSGIVGIRIKDVAGGIQTYNPAIQTLTLYLTEDFYDTSRVIMSNSSGTAIRRVYIGSIVKSNNNILDVHCYSIGDLARVLVNGGSNIFNNATYINNLAFPGDQEVVLEIKYKGYWFPLPTIPNSGYGAKAYVVSDKIESITGSVRLLDGALSKNVLMIPVSTDAIVTNAPARLVIKRGY